MSTKKIPTVPEIQNRLNTKQEVFLSATSPEIGTNNFWLDVGLELTLQPGIYNIGYVCTTVLRISGTAVNEEIVGYVALRKSDNTQFDSLGSVRNAYIEDNAFSYVTSHEGLSMGVVVTAETTIKMSIAKSESTESGTINCFTRALVSSSFDSVENGKTRIWAQRIGDVA